MYYKKKLLPSSVHSTKVCTAYMLFFGEEGFWFMSPTVSLLDQTLEGVSE